MTSVMLRGIEKTAAALKTLMQKVRKEIINPPVCCERSPTVHVPSIL